LEKKELELELEAAEKLDNFADAEESTEEDDSEDGDDE
jgi:hypothetical protein